MTSRGSATLRQVDPAVVDVDPFWATVVREHPDAAYVLLPPQPPPDPPLAAADVRQRVQAAVAAWRDIAPAVSADEPPAISWCGRPGAQRFVVQLSLVGIGRAAGVDRIAAVGVRLGTAGWGLWPQRLDDRSVLRARDDADDPALEVEAVAGDGATVVTLTTAPLSVDPGVAATVRQEAASWL